ncbi:MAG TPA: tRNA pseudouridine(55) synthase TruB [Bacteroidota bacterium]|nr:tRNA pseudouridine(55) synthase TruB [Bacteroidota bacterium]
MRKIIERSDPVQLDSDLGSLDFEKGELLLIDKPLDWTSFDVVHRVRDLFHVQKVGHAGTLDPKATGLLILCTGRRTKEIDRYSGCEKEYEGVMTLGATTASLDSETPRENQKDYSSVTLEAVKAVFESHRGVQMQVPPMYSAAKHSGKPLYKYARKGRSLERQPKEVTISDLGILDFAPPFVRFRVVCSKGTYVRSLVDQCGKELGCGAFLSELRRVRIGDLSLTQALDLDGLYSLSQRRSRLMAEARR